MTTKLWHRIHIPPVVAVLDSRRYRYRLCLRAARRENAAARPQWSRKHTQLIIMCIVGCDFGPHTSTGTQIASAVQVFSGPCTANPCTAGGVQELYALAVMPAFQPCLQRFLSCSPEVCWSTRRPPMHAHHMPVAALCALCTAFLHLCRLFCCFSFQHAFWIFLYRILPGISQNGRPFLCKFLHTRST